MQIECSFQHFSVQYDFGFWNENVLRVKGGYFNKSRLANRAKMWILKKGVPLLKGSLTVWALYAYFSDSQNAAFELLVWYM